MALDAFESETALLPRGLDKLRMVKPGAVEVTDTSVPTVADNVTVDVPAAAQRDIVERQERASIKDSDIAKQAGQILMSTDVNAAIQLNNGKRTFGDRIIHPGFLKQAQDDPLFRASVIREYVEQNRPVQLEEDQPYVALEEGLPPELTEGMDTEFIEAMNDLVGKNVRLRDALGTGDPSFGILGKRLILNKFSNGEALGEYYRSVMNLPGDVARIPYLIPMITSAAEAVYGASKEGIFGEQEFADALPELFAESISQSGMIKFMEGNLNKNVITEDRITYLQRWYKKNYIETYGQEAYDKNHTSPVYTVDDAGNMAYSYDESGNIETMEVPLPRTVASAILELSFNELPFYHKMGRLFLEQAGFTAGAVAWSSRVGKGYANRVAKARTDDPDAYEGKSDFEVLQELKEGDFANAQNVFAATYFGGRDIMYKIPLGPGKVARGIGGLRSRGQLNVGNVLFEQRSVLQRYNEDIKGISRKIDELENPADGIFKPNYLERIRVLQDQRSILVKNRDSYEKGLKISPYSKAALRDEILIAGAMAGAQEVMPDMSVFGVSGELVVGIVAPMITTPLVNGIGSAAYKVGDAVSEGTLTDVAKFLESSDYLPFVDYGTLIKGDERALRGVLEQQGIRLSDDRVKAFNQFNRILNTVNPDQREKVYQSLVNYNIMMDSFKEDLTDLGMSEARVAETVGKLQLSVATASGLAPLIAYQQGKVMDVTGKALTRRSDMTALMRATVDQEHLANGIDTNIKIVRDMLAQDGINILENSPIQNFIGKLEASAVKVREDAEAKKQAFVLLLDNYIANIGTANSSGTDDIVDEDTVTELLTMATELESASILPGGTVQRIFNKAEELERIEVNMLNSAGQLGDELLEFSGDVDRSTFMSQSRRAADLVFDIAAGRRRALVSIEYNKADDLLPEGTTFDLQNMVRRFASMTGELDDVPLREQVSGVGAFMKSEKGLQRTFTKMARQGLNKNTALTPEGIQKIIRSRSDPNSPQFVSEDYNEIDLALDMMKDQKQGDPLAFFSATFSDSENLFRHFDTKIRTDDSITIIERRKIRRDMKGIIDDAYKGFSPEFYDQVKIARATHEELVGNRLDPGTYGGTVTRGRGRTNPKDMRPGDATYGYKNIDRDHPEVPFMKMAKIATQMMDLKSGSVEWNALKKQLKEEQHRVLYFLGARLDGDNMVFDLTDPSQRATLKVYNRLVEAHLNFAMSENLRGKTDIAVDILQEGAPLALPSESRGIQRAVNILEIEGLFATNVINSKGNRDIQRGASFENVRSLAQRFDDILLQNTDYQKAYTELRNRVDPVKGVLGVAAKREISDMNDTINRLNIDASLVNRKDAFWDTYFKNLNAENYGKLVNRFVADSGLDRDEITKALQYMYVEGLMAKGKTRRRLDPQTEEVVMDLDAVEAFVDIVSDPDQRALAQQILGKKHADALFRMNNWINKSMGNALDLRRGRGATPMTIDSAFSRIFNIARGMVSPLYVGTEVATRALMINKQNLLDLALSDRTAAEIMAKVLTDPDAITKQDVKTLGIRMEAHLAREAVTGAIALPTLEELTTQADQQSLVGTLAFPKSLTSDEQEEEEETDENVQ